MKKVILIISIALTTFLLVACKDKTPEIKEPVTYTVTFNLDGGTADYTTRTIKENEVVSKPSDPVKNDYTFIQWELDGNKYDFNSLVTKDITLVATWSEHLTIKFVYDIDGINDTILKQENGTLVTKPEDPTKQGFIFKGWYVNDSLYDFDSVLTESVVITAKWEKIPVIMVEKNLFTVDFGDKNISGYDTNFFTFTNLLDSKQYTFNKKRAQIWANTVFGHVVSMGPLRDKPEAILEIDLRYVENPSKLEFNLGAWSKTSYNNIKNKNDISIKVEKQVGDSWVSLKDINGTENLKDYIVDETKLSHIAVLLDGSAIYRIIYLNPSAPTTGNTAEAIAIDDLSVYHLEEDDGAKLTVYFDHGYTDSEITALNVVVGEQLERPEDPIRRNYQFVDWYLGNDLYNFNNPVTSELNLIAKWEVSHYDVTFDLGHLDLDNVEILTIPKNEQLQKPIDPERLGYTFNGWYQTDISRDINARFVFNETLTEDIRLYGSWQKNELGVEHERNDDELLSYYSSINGLTGEELVLELRSILTNTHKPVDYSYAKVALAKADLHPYQEGKVLTMYDRNYVTAFWGNPSEWEREHVWPNAKLGIDRVSETEKSQGSDLHNLRAIIKTVNIRRSNYYFVESLGSPIGHVVKPSTSYYPGNEDAGDVARILMYMAVRYEVLKLTSDETLLSLTPNYIASSAYMGTLSELYNWHLNDPVDEFEINRNNVINNEQKNRNPFIDHPELFKEVFEYFMEIDEARTTKVVVNTNDGLHLFKIVYVDLNRKRNYM